MLNHKSHKKYLTLLSALSILLAVTGCEETYKATMTVSDDHITPDNQSCKENGAVCTTESITDGKCCNSTCIPASDYDQSECNKIDKDECKGKDDGVECTNGLCCDKICTDATQWNNSRCGCDKTNSDSCKDKENTVCTEIDNKPEFYQCREAAPPTECEGKNNGSSCNDDAGLCCNNTCITDATNWNSSSCGCDHTNLDACTQPRECTAINDKPEFYHCIPSSTTDECIDKNNGDTCTDGYCCNQECITTEKCIICDESGENKTYGCDKGEICESNLCKSTCEANEGESCCEDNTCNGNNLICQTWDEQAEDHHKCVSCGDKNQPCCVVNGENSCNLNFTPTSSEEVCTCQCGSENQACCGGEECNNGLTCSGQVCTNPCDNKIDGFECDLNSTSGRCCQNSCYLYSEMYNPICGCTSSSCDNGLSCSDQNGFKICQTNDCSSINEPLPCTTATVTSGVCCGGQCKAQGIVKNDNPCACNEECESNHCSDSESIVCIECTEDTETTDCGSDKPKCISHKCEECKIDSDCADKSDNKIKCNTSTHVCENPCAGEVSDTNGSDCDGYGISEGKCCGNICYSSANYSKTICGCEETCQNVSGNRCDPTIGAGFICRCNQEECSNVGQNYYCETLTTCEKCEQDLCNDRCCSSETPVCATIDGTEKCAICDPVKDIGCPNAHCSLTGDSPTCVECTQNEHCNTNPDKTICLINHCAVCDPSKNPNTPLFPGTSLENGCKDDAKYCKLDGSECVECLQNKDCDFILGQSCSNGHCEGKVCNHTIANSSDCSETNTYILNNNTLTPPIPPHSNKTICLVICGTNDISNFPDNNIISTEKDLVVVGNNAVIKSSTKDYKRTTPLFNMGNHKLIFKNIKLEFDAEFGYSKEGGDGSRDMRGIIANELSNATIENIHYEGKITFIQPNGTDTITNIGGLVGSATSCSFINNTLKLTNTTNGKFISINNTPFENIGGIIGSAQNLTKLTGNTVTASNFSISTTGNNISNVGGLIGNASTITKFDGNKVSLGSLSIATTNQGNLISIGGFIGSASGVTELSNSSNFIQNYSISLGSGDSKYIAGLIGSVSSSGGSGDVPAATGAGAPSITLNTVQNVIITPPDIQNSKTSVKPLFGTGNLDSLSKQVLSYFGRDDSSPDDYACLGESFMGTEPKGVTSSSVDVLAYKNDDADGNKYSPMCKGGGAPITACCVAQKFNEKNESNETQWKVYKYNSSTLIPLFVNPDDTQFSVHEAICKTCN